MKRKIPLLMLMSILLLVNVSAQNNVDKYKLRQTIDEIGKAVPSAESDPSKLSKITEYLELEGGSPAIWRMAIDNLPEVAPSRNDQVILFNALQALPPHEYLEFLYKALELYSENEISIGVFTHQILFPGGRMQLFLSHNYDQPEVAAFLKKTEEVLKKNGEPAMFNVQEALSGKLKTLHDAARMNHPEMGKQPIPLLQSAALPTTTEAQTATNPMPEATPNQASNYAASLTVSSEPRPIVQAELSNSSPWPWIIGGAILLGVGGGLLFIFRRK